MRRSSKRSEAAATMFGATASLVVVATGFSLGATNQRSLLHMCYVPTFVSSWGGRGRSSPFYFLYPLHPWGNRHAKWRR